jgi:putative DNA primase/helicase
LKKCLRTLEAQALFDGPTHPVHLRVAEANGCLYLDLANEQWEAVEITAAGWHVIPHPPVKFRRVPSMAPLPHPERGGDITLLRPLINIGSDANWQLLVAFLVQTFRPQGPYPVLVLHGPYGSAKSTLTKMIRALTDPNAAPLRAFPRTEEDLFVSAQHGWVLAFDNLSTLSRRDADALCRLASGAGFATRKRYTNATESLLTAARSVIVNSIEEVVTRADLRDRSIALHLPAITSTQRLDERQLWQDFAAVHPRILGALLDAVSVAWRDQDWVSLPAMPRMADFARWACAAAPACGWRPEAFLRAYAPSDHVPNDRWHEDAPVVQAVRNLMATLNGVHQ